MKRKTNARRWTKVAAMVASGGMMLQYAGCLGSDPQFFLTSSVVNALVANIVSTLFNSVVSGLAV